MYVTSEIEAKIYELSGYCWLESTCGNVEKHEHSSKTTKFLCRRHVRVHAVLRRVPCNYTTQNSLTYKKPIYVYLLIWCENEKIWTIVFLLKSNFCSKEGFVCFSRPRTHCSQHLKPYSLEAPVISTGWTDSILDFHFLFWFTLRGYLIPNFLL